MQKSKTSNVDRKRMMYKTNRLRIQNDIIKTQSPCSELHAWLMAFRLSRPGQRRNNLSQDIRLCFVSLQHWILLAFRISQLMIFHVAFVVDRQIEPTMTRVSRLFDRFAQNVRRVRL